MPILSTFLLTQAWKPYALDGLHLTLPIALARTRREGAPSEIRFWGANAGKDRRLFMMITPVVGKGPGDIPAGFSLMEMVRSTGGVIRSQSDARLVGWPGITASVTMPDGERLRFAAFTTGKSLYTITAGGKGDAGDEFGRRVLDSVTLDKTVGVGPLRTTGPGWSRVSLGALKASVELPRKPKGEATQRQGRTVFHSWSARYANRAYTVSYVDFSTSDAPRPQTMKQSLDSINFYSAGRPLEKTIRKTSTTLAGLPARRLESLSPLGSDLAAIVVAAYKGNRCVTISALVPRVLTNSPEVKRFFASFHSD